MFHGRNHKQDIRGNEEDQTWEDARKKKKYRNYLNIKKLRKESHKKKNVHKGEWKGLAKNFRSFAYHRYREKSLSWTKSDLGFESSRLVSW